MDPRDALRHGIALYRKLYAECNRQAMVVGRMLTTLVDGGRAAAMFKNKAMS